MDKKITGNLGCFDAGYLSFFRSIKLFQLRLNFIGILSLSHTSL